MLLTSLSLSSSFALVCVSGAEDSTRYVKLLASVFDQCGVFREWLAYLDSPSFVGSAATKAALEDHLTRISEFAYCVLCNIVIRDLKSLLKRYIKHCMRTMGAH